MALFDSRFEVFVNGIEFKKSFTRASRAIRYAEKLAIDKFLYVEIWVVTPCNRYLFKYYN